MKRSKILAIAATGALVAAMALAGCGGAQSASSSAASASGSASAASASASAASASASSAAASAASASASAAASEAASASAAAPAASAAAPAAAPAASGDSYIGEQAAIDIALADAGFSAGDVRELEAELDRDDYRIHYDVEFKNGDREYDYDVDAVTGEILSVDSEIDD